MIAPKPCRFGERGRHRYGVRGLFREKDSPRSRSPDHRGGSRRPGSRLPVRPGSVAEPVQQHGGDAKVLARLQEIPPLEFALPTRDDLLDLREEAEPVSLKKQGAGPRLVQGPRVRLPGIRGPSERPQDPFDMVDAPSVLAFADRA